jgi:secreted trypsin-like serine protease
MLTNLVLFGLVLLTVVSREAAGQNQCAKAGHSSFIVDGKISLPGKWPFMVALFNTTNQRFFCAGSLVSFRHVLTAAHCIHLKEKRAPISPADVIAYMGKFNLSSTLERGSVTADPSNFIVHPSWKPFSAEYEADIAIIVLKEAVPERFNINPICLWPSNLKPVGDAERGTVIGW